MMNQATANDNRRLISFCMVYENDGRINTACKCAYDVDEAEALILEELTGPEFNINVGPHYTVVNDRFARFGAYDTLCAELGMRNARLENIASFRH